MQSLFLLQIGAFHQVLMHADRTFDLSAPAKQAAERKVQLNGLWIDLHHFDESFDRLVGLLIEEKIEPLEVRHRQRPRFGHELLDVDACRKPPQGKKQRQREQPPIFNIHDEPVPR